MNFKKYDSSSNVEEYAVKQAKHKLIYPPTEKIGVIEVDNYPDLGKLTAFRFIEWVLKNPDGLIALPTGKTPEYFIKWTKKIISGWKTGVIQELLERYGIHEPSPPSFKGVRFVQIDEFYPMDSRQHNSFHYYVNEFYIKGFGFSQKNALFIDATSLGLPKCKTMAEIFPDNAVDLTLRVRKVNTNLERIQREIINRVDEFCMEYETKIRDLGGIGYFLGGIGPDGHIAFNVRGSSIHSVTRLTATNYETQAAAANDLGGIEISRNRLVITIGLATITYNPTATVIIIAAGEAKSRIIAHAIQEKKNPQYPASVLQDLPGARFYLTKGAAYHLVERHLTDFQAKKKFTDEETDRVVISTALAGGKALKDLTEDDFSKENFARTLRKKLRMSHSDIVVATRKRIIDKIENGLKHISKTTFLHTEPHHDDIMLSYLASIYHLVRDPSNVHYFANLTSGFTSVTNDYVLSILGRLEKNLETEYFKSRLAESYFDPASIVGKMADVYRYLDGVAAGSAEMKEIAESCRLLRNMFEVYRTNDLLSIRLRMRGLNEYFRSQYPGAKDTPDVQMLKGTIREWEVELLWAYFGIEASSIFPLRLGFYTGDIFSDEPEINRDVMPIYKLIQKVRPDIVSVAFDPEGSGPDTHYKALQAVAGALRMYEEKSGNRNIRVWGYRNVWYRFDPAEANLYVPVSLNSLSLLHTAFMNCFGSQRAASFPSYDHDGPFSELAQRIQVEQYGMIKTCLGNDYFLKNNHPRLRAARGMIFLMEMDLEEFYSKVRELKRLTVGGTG